MKVKTLLIAAVSALTKEKNPNCPSNDPEFLCNADCENLYIECVIQCDADISCISSCNRDSLKCNEQASSFAVFKPIRITMILVSLS